MGLMMIRRWIVVLVLLMSLPGRLEAGWVWTPQTGWLGPGGAVKDTPEEQLKHALAFFEKPDYKRALVEFKKLVRHYKASREAAEGQYYIGRCYEGDGDYYATFLAYR